MNSNQESASMSEKTTKAIEHSSGAGQISKRPDSSATGGSGTGSSIMDQVAKRNPFMPGGLKAKLPSFMDNMPGAFNSKRGSSSQGGTIAGVPAAQQSTKQASHPLLCDD